MRIISNRHEGVTRLDTEETSGRADEIIEFVESQVEDTYGMGLRPDTPAESRELMAEFCRQWTVRGEVSPVLIEWAAACFDAIVGEKNDSMTWPARALGLSLPPQRPRKNAKRDLRITRRVAELVDGGKTLDDAYADVADAEDLDASNVGKIYRANRDRAF